MAANPFVLPTLFPIPPSEQDITDSLNNIFKGFPLAANEYALYFQLMPTPQGVSDLQNLLSGASTTPDKPVTEQIHAITQPAIGHPIGITGIVQSKLVGAAGAVGCDVFQQKQPATPGGGPSNAIFIVLDGFNNTPVPIEIACAIEANFIDGFVTRLVLGQFKKFWDSNQGTPGSPSYAVTPSFDLNLGAVNSNQATLAQFSDPATYPPYHVIMQAPNGIPSYTQDLAAVLSQSPIASIGMLYGWHAAEQLEGADHANPAQPLVSEAFKLLGYRFSMRDFGEMTAFTMNYLNGAAENESIQSVMNGGVEIKPSDIADLLYRLSTDTKIDDAKAFLIGFENVLTAEFYAISQNSTVALAADKLNLLTQYFSFIQGFHQGIARSAESHYQETVNLAFGLGYHSGFTDGYSLGYANGYIDGFAAGNAAAWKAANQIITSLQGQITTLQNQLTQVQNAQNGGGSGSGFWDTLGKIGKLAETAVGKISSLSGAAASAAGGAGGAGAVGGGAEGAVAQGGGVLV